MWICPNCRSANADYVPECVTCGDIGPYGEEIRRRNTTSPTDRLAVIIMFGFFVAMPVFVTGVMNVSARRQAAAYTAARQVFDPSQSNGSISALPATATFWESARSGRYVTLQYQSRLPETIRVVYDETAGSRYAGIPNGTQSGSCQVIFWNGSPAEVDYQGHAYLTRLNPLYATRFVGTAFKASIALLIGYLLWVARSFYKLVQSPRIRIH